MKIPTLLLTNGQGTFWWKNLHLQALEVYLDGADTLARVREHLCLTCSLTASTLCIIISSGCELILFTYTEWICEGDIPEPVAFTLQLYRNFKIAEPPQETGAKEPIGSADGNNNSNGTDNTTPHTGDKGVSDNRQKTEISRNAHPPEAVHLLIVQTFVVVHVTQVLHIEAVAMFTKYAEFGRYTLTHHSLSL